MGVEKMIASKIPEKRRAVDGMMEGMPLVPNSPV